MPSPLAHVGIALACCVAVTPRLSLGVAACAATASVAPDADILLVALLPGGIDWHRGPTHSVLGAALLGALVAAAGSRLLRAGWGWREYLVVVAAAVLHVPADWSTGQPGAPASYGVPWAWPFVADKAIAARPWFGAFHIDRPGFLAHMLAPEALPVYGKEALTVLLALATAAGFKAALRTRSRAP